MYLREPTFLFSKYSVSEFFKNNHTTKYKHASLMCNHFTQSHIFYIYQLEYSKTLYNYGGEGLSAFQKQHFWGGILGYNGKGGAGVLYCWWKSFLFMKMLFPLCLIHTHAYPKLTAWLWTIWNAFCWLRICIL